MNVMCIVTDGFEELEAVGTIALLRRAGIRMSMRLIIQWQQDALISQSISWRI